MKKPANAQTKTALEAREAGIRKHFLLRRLAELKSELKTVGTEGQEVTQQVRAIEDKNSRGSIAALDEAKPNISA